jgi:hypothetical protein
MIQLEDIQVLCNNWLKTREKRIMICHLLLIENLQLIKSCREKDFRGVKYFRIKTMKLCLISTLK